MWGFAKNNEIIEGFRRKMKLIQYPVYGYKNSFYVKDCGMVEKKRAKRTKNVLQYPMC